MIMACIGAYVVEYSCSVCREITACSEQHISIDHCARSVVWDWELLFGYQSTRHKWAHNTAVSWRRNSCSTWMVCRQEDMQEGVTENKWPEKCRRKKGLEFDGLKNKGQIVKKLSESVDVGISNDQQQQQTESTPSSTDTTSAVKPLISAENYYCYTDLTLHNLHCINLFKSLKIHPCDQQKNKQTDAVTKYSQLVTRF